MKSFIVLLFLLLLHSCSGSGQWVDRHGAYKPQGMQETLVPEVGDRWILVAPVWYSEISGIENSQIFDSVGQNIRLAFIESLQQAQPHLRTIPTSTYDAFPDVSSHLLAPGRYQKIRIPAQGQVVKVDEFAPPLLLLLHEIVIGPNVQRMHLYDVRHSNQVTESGPRKVKTLGAVVSWTLWDNRLQRALLTGVSESTQEYQGEKNADAQALLVNVLKSLAQQMTMDMQGNQP